MTQVETGRDAIEAADAQASPSVLDRARSRLVLLGAAGILAFFGSVGMVLALKPFSDSAPIGEPALDVFAAGPFDVYEPGTIAYFQNEHFYLIRMEDGAFLALYDLGPQAQERVDGGELPALECRIVVRQDEEMAGWLASAPAVPGFGGTGFYDACNGVAWDARGRPVWGAESSDLDRFPVGTMDGIVRVNLGERRCMNDFGPGSACVQTQ